MGLTFNDFLTYVISQYFPVVFKTLFDLTFEDSTFPGNENFSFVYMCYFKVVNG